VQLSFRKELPPQASERVKKRDIVFIHGTGSNSDMWKAQVPFFVERGHRLTLIDLRGHGNTPEPMEETSLRVHLDDVADTLSAAQVNLPAYFVGHSLGAIIPVFLARERPEWIETIFAASLPGKVLPPVVLSFRLFLNGPMQTMRKSGLHRRLAWRERTLFEMDRFTLSEIAEQFGKVDVLEAIGNVKCAIHFAAGRFDPVAPFWQVMAMQKRLKKSSLQVFEWGGHNFMDARPTEFNNWIDSLITDNGNEDKPVI
jgi:pimeloyl-ACP methyl ester carboxylesterase